MDEDRPGARRRTWWSAFGAYLLISFVLYGLPALAHFSTRFVGEGSADAKLYVWDLAWWPWALLHATNPFHSSFVWAPSGVNLAWVTSLPGPALVMFPVARLFGGIAASNVISVVSPPLAAATAFLLCRELTGRFWPSFAGGYLYGFSTYEVGQMHGHVNLFLTFPVPLAAYLVVRFVRGDMSRRRFVPALAATLVAQFSISTEVFATMAFFGVIALGAALAAVRELRPRVRELVSALGLASALSTVAVAPYLWYATRSVPPALSVGVRGTSIDLLSFVVPRPGTLIGGPPLVAFTRSFAANVSEDGGYLGPILVCVLVFILVTRWRDTATRLLFAFVALAAVLALGATLEVGGRRSIPLPWRIFEHVPILKDVKPERFTMYMWLGVAVIVARWLARLPTRPQRLLGTPWLLVGAAAIMLLPNVFLPNLHQPEGVPRFFADGLYRRYLTSGETILILHAPQDEGDEMLWQEMTDFAFKMPQGHTGPEPASFAADAVTQDMLTGQPFGVTARELRGWLFAHAVRDVVVTDDIAFRWRFLISPACQSVPIRVGGVQLYRVRPSAA